MRILLLISIGLIGFSFTQAQLSTEDKDLILLNQNSENIFTEREVKFGFKKMHKLNPVNLTAGSLLFFYQKFISVQISSGCLYSPTCSAYSKNLFSSYNPIKALFATGDRIMRCDRLSEIDIPNLHKDQHTHKAHESVHYYCNDKNHHH